MEILLDSVGRKRSTSASVEFCQFPLRPSAVLSCSAHFYGAARNSLSKNEGKGERFRGDISTQWSGLGVRVHSTVAAAACDRQGLPAGFAAVSPEINRRAVGTLVAREPSMALA
jgi:hypothetical protein